MKSYLVLWFNSEGKNPGEITRRLTSIGFRPAKGNYDYIYDWDNKATTEDAIKLADRVQQSLKGCNVSFKIETL